MEYFLERIARSVKDEFGNTLNRHCLVFPGRRAGLYFLRHLSANLLKPAWAPPIYTINDLFRSCSSLQIAGSEILLFELYKVYRKIRKNPESFDEFYFWGDMLINDFDDVDKYLVNAVQLFGNVKDIKEIDQQFGGLTPEQKEIIRRFWVNFDSSKPTNEKSGFEDIWSLLYELYSVFRKSLRDQNLAYEGMIFRDLAESRGESLLSSESWDMIHFIGFNALNECEKSIMSVLKKAGKARFYWDYDNSYVSAVNYNSAGFFMNGNLKEFGNDMPQDWNYNTKLSSENGVKRTVIETSSDVAQVKLIPGLVNAIPGLNPGNAHNTAIVLADENLLVPMLSSLPANSADINLTMGYPLKQTMVYTLIRHLMELQRNSAITDGAPRFYSENVISIIRHPLTGNILSEEAVRKADEIIRDNTAWLPQARFSGSEQLLAIFRKQPDPASLSAWLRDILSAIASDSRPGDGGMIQENIRNEFIYRTVLALNRLETILKDTSVAFSTETYTRLLDRMLRTQSVPFSGEPLSGIQIMGILETRALDFKNLIILSVNEGVLPSISSSSSFIPFSLREAFGLPSVNHQESIYAYHFYRLMQRAENVTLIYNSNAEGLRSGEMSRFLIQMNYDRALKPEFINPGFEIRTHLATPGIIQRNASHIEVLESNYLNGRGRLLSPSAINAWLSCRMKFFYRYVKGLKEPDTISEEIDPAMFGNILHEVMHLLYNDHTGNVISAEFIESLIRDRLLLEKTIVDAINIKFRKGHEGFVGGAELIVREVLHSYLRKILNADKTIAPLTVLGLEKYYDFAVHIGYAGRTVQVKTGGYVDRIDKTGDITRIVDYKTGTVAESLCSTDDLFREDRKKDLDGWLQILLYCEAFLLKEDAATLRPSIYRIKKMKPGNLNDRLILKQGRDETPVDDYRQVRDSFIPGLNDVITRMFSPDEPFTMTEDSGRCRYCPYKILCSG